MFRCEVTHPPTISCLSLCAHARQELKDKQGGLPPTFSTNTIPFVRTGDDSLILEELTQGIVVGKTRFQSANDGQRQNLREDARVMVLCSMAQSSTLEAKTMKDSVHV